MGIRYISEKVSIEGKNRVIVDSWKRSIDIRKKIHQKYWQILLIYILDFFVPLIVYVFLYQIFGEMGECSFGCFLVFLILGGLIIAGFIGLVQLRFMYMHKREYSVEMLFKINIVVWIIYGLAGMVFGIRVQKIVMLILGIILSIVLAAIIFFAHSLLYHKVNTFNKLYVACKRLEESISDYGGIEIYNQYADSYNNMNKEIEYIGHALGEKDRKTKPIKKRCIQEDLEDMLRKIPALDISDIRIFTIGQLNYAYRIRSYIKEIYKFSKDVEKTLKKAKVQSANLRNQIEKKSELTKTIEAALDHVSKTELLTSISNSEFDFEEGNKNMRSSYKKLARKSRAERKIKSVKRGIFK